MKKVKIMLTAIGVFAIVGGALAYKEKKRGVFVYCTKANTAGNVCTSFTTDASFQAGGTGAIFKYVITTDTFNCTIGIVICVNQGRIII